MPLITFKPARKSVDVPPGTELLDAAKRAGVEIDSPCGGKGTCGKCLVRIRAGKVASDSLGLLPQTAIDDGYVLACKSRILAEPVTVEVPERLGRVGGKFAETLADAWLIRQDLLPKTWEYEPLAAKWHLAVPPPALADGLSDLDRLVRAIQLQWGHEPVQVPMSVLRILADTLRAQDGNVTASLIREAGTIHVVGLQAGDTTARNYGVAVDVGTTTIAVQLVYLPLAQIVAVHSDYNDQISCGLDVISRINYARRPERLEELRTRVLGVINKLIGMVAQDQSVEPAEITNAVISGNTTMTHLLLGLKPEYIRIGPYTPTVMQAPYLTAAEVGIAINPESWVCISPNVGSYVGGDITAGLLCTDLATDTASVNLFIDIGTNGELVLGNHEFLLTCACSAGPAFEGGGIECGMRAALGAIERVEVDPATGKPKYWTVGNVRPKGICGSGMISLLANLFTTGWIDAAGKLCRSRPSPCIRVDGRQAFYTLAEAHESASGKALYINELDIANIVRAKAAIYSACALMVQQVGMTLDSLDNVFIGGGFGRFLDLEKAIILGLIPDLPREKYHYIGNSSLMGSYMVLVSREFRQRQCELAKRMTYVELNSDPGYMDQYMAALFLPHTDPALFPTVKRP